MSDINCPYCGAEQDINHDDGNGYDEGETHQQECGECEKTFIFTTTVCFYYDVERADCLNGEKHKWRAAPTWPVEHTNLRCSCCDEIKPMPKNFILLLMGRGLG